MGLRNGDEYLSGLKDDREIWYDGQQIKDVRNEPGLRNTALTVAQYYDLQMQPRPADLMTYETPDGDRAHLSLHRDPLRSKICAAAAAAYGAWAEVTGRPHGPGTGLHERLHDGGGRGRVPLGQERPRDGPSTPTTSTCTAAATTCA